MSSYDRISRRAVVGTIALTLIGLAGCSNVRPLYGSGGADASGGGDLAEISFAPMSDRVGQRLRNELIRLITPSGEPADPLYRMTLQLSISESDVLVRRNSDVDRKTLSLSVAYRILDVDTEEEVFAGNAFGDVSFNRVASEYANIRARRDAENRAANIVAEQIRSTVAARLAS
ncbi:hypothetical protein MNBD_ALPHA09-13 [hydrothermal vent metagenome]|uniref:LPS-assembly lipoprotein n=1 Tax=hydrothermal vent metagenome TaxID=652676 RepID=A0A3B0TFE4_9ZZZZ